MKKLSREENPAHVLIYSPSKTELGVFTPTIGLYTFATRMGTVEVVRNLILRHPVLEPRVAAVAFSMMAKGATAARRKMDQDLDTGFEFYSWMADLMAMIGLAGLTGLIYVAVW